jgi:hypothetical protein
MKRGIIAYSMQYVGRKVFFAVAQQPFEHVGDSGIVNNFATLVPLIGADGEVLDPSDFRHYGLVFWMVRQHALRFADPGRLLVGKLEHAVNPGRLEYQLTPDSADVVQPSDLIEILPVEHEDVREPRDLVNVDSVIVLDHPPTSRAVGHCPRPKALGQVADAKESPAAVALGASDILVPNALFNLDRPSFQIHVFPLQAEDLRNSGAGRDAGFDNELVRVSQSRQHTRRLVER